MVTRTCSPHPGPLALGIAPSPLTRNRTHPVSMVLTLCSGGPRRNFLFLVGRGRGLISKEEPLTHDQWLRLFSRLLRHIIAELVLTTFSLGGRLDRTPNRGSLGGGVASTRSECVGAESPMMFRHSHPMRTRRAGRHPLCAYRAGRQRQSNHASPASAVENERRAMASNSFQVAVGERGLKGLDKKPIGLN